MRNEQPAEILAPREGDGYYKTRGLQWLTHCPHINPSGKIALQLLCSLVSDDKPVRLITLEEIGKLLPSGKPVAVGEEPKCMSASNVALLLEGLSAVGQVVTPEGTPVKVSRKKKTPLRLMPYRYPRHPCDCSRNAHDALARIRGEEPRWPLAAMPGEAHTGQDQDSGPASKKDQNLGPKDQNLGPKDQDSAQNRVLTCDDSPLSMSFPQSSPLSQTPAVTSAPADSAGAATEEREPGRNQDHAGEHDPAGQAAAEARSEHPVEVPEQRGQEQAVPSEAAVEFTAGLPGRLGRETVSRLAVLVDAAFLEGYTPESLRTELAERVDVARIRSRAAVPGLYERALRDLPPVTAAQAAGLERCPDHPARYRDGCLDCAMAVPA